MIDSKRIYVTSRGYHEHDIVNWSIPVRPETTDDNAVDIMSAIAGITVGRFTWGWKKPSKEAVAHMPPSARMDSLSLIRWTIWWSNHVEYKPYGQPLSPTWLKTFEARYISIPFADPKQTAWVTHWQHQRSHSGTMLDETWARIFKVFNDHVWSNIYRQNERPGQASEIDDIKFKVSHSATFVKNITKE